MNPQRYGNSQAKRTAEDDWQSVGAEGPQQEGRATDAEAKAEQAARSVMHPEGYDPDWRYYYGAMGG